MSTKMQQQIEWRRAKVMELLSKGESNQSEIAKALQVDLSIISRDVYFLRQQAYGIGKIYTAEEIEQAKQSPSFEREYNLKYLDKYVTIDGYLAKGLISTKK